MIFTRQMNILEYTLQALLRRAWRNAGIVLVFSCIIFITASVLLLSYAFRREAMLILKDAPALIVQRMSAGRHEMVPLSLATAVRKIPGVAGVEPRYWGYYYDSLTHANYTVMAAGPQAGESLRLLKGSLPGVATSGAVAIGRGVSRVRFADIGGEITLLSSQGMPQTFTVSGVFEADSDLLTADLIVMSSSDFGVFFNLPGDVATDLAVDVRNENEAPVVARKIRAEFPDTRPILRSEIVRTYDAVFGWRSGMVLMLFSGALVAFIILAWDKATGLSAEEKREIGILKAIGWETADILAMKFWEGLSVSLASFLIGLIAAYVHVFVFNASIFATALKGWSVIYPDFRLTPEIAPYQIAVLLSLTVIPYIAATLVPSWKAAITDPDEVMRG